MIDLTFSEVNVRWIGDILDPLYEVVVSSDVHRIHVSFVGSGDVSHSAELGWSNVPFPGEIFGCCPPSVIIGVLHHLWVDACRSVRMGELFAAEVAVNFALFIRIQARREQCFEIRYFARGMPKDFDMHELCQEQV